LTLIIEVIFKSLQEKEPKRKGGFPRLCAYLCTPTENKPDWMMDPNPYCWSSDAGRNHTFDIKAIVAKAGKVARGLTKQKRSGVSMADFYSFIQIHGITDGASFRVAAAKRMKETGCDLFLNMAEADQKQKSIHERVTHLRSTMEATEEELKAEDQTMEPLSLDEILYTLNEYHYETLRLEMWHRWGKIKRLNGRPVSATTYIIGGLSNACKSQMAIAIAKYYYNSRIWHVNKPEDLAKIKPGKIRKHDIVIIDEFNTTGCQSVEMKNLVNREQGNHVKVRYTSCYIPFGVTVFITTNCRTLDEWLKPMNGTANDRKLSGWTDSCENVRIHNLQFQERISYCMCKIRSWNFSIISIPINLTGLHPQDHILRNQLLLL
jgi:hypothetical protein